MRWTDEMLNVVGELDAGSVDRYDEASVNVGGLKYR